MKKKQRKSSGGGCRGHQNPAIKGYLPIRISLPPIQHHHSSFTSFIYIKEHIQRSQGSSTKSNSSNSDAGGGGSTLFIANAPSNGPIRTDLFLRALFEPYGDISRVTVAKDPRKAQLMGGSGEDDNKEAVEIFREAALSGLDDSNSSLFATKSTSRKGDGKFAHVVFTSSKEMKKALKSIKREISEVSNDDGAFVMQLDGDKMDELMIESEQQLSTQKQNEEDDDEDEDDEEETTNQPTTSTLSGIHAIAAQSQQKAYRHMSREKLMEMCNSAMSAFETQEAELERRAKLAAEQPDDDGFITVTHKKSNATPVSFGITNDFEEDQYHRRKAGKRSRKRKANTTSGADELSDFYRFQLKESRKKEVSNLKERFEEDLKQVKKMKEERAYRPF